MFLDLWHRIAIWFRNRRTTVATVPVRGVILDWQPRSRHKPETAAAPTESVVPPEPPALPKCPEEKNKLFRVLERRRRQHDKFVIPKGELPTREPAGPRLVTQEIKPRPTKPDIEPALPESLPDRTGLGIYIAEPHHEDSRDVLYKCEEVLGEFNFRDTILQQLDRYFFYLRRMKKNDPDAYGFYRQVGATLLPYMATGSWRRRRTPKEEQKEKIIVPEIPAWFNEHRPAFGCFAYGADPETEKFEQTQKDAEHPKLEMWVPKFMYFLKYELPPANVQPMADGDIYMLTIWWDRPDKKKCKHGIPQDLPIFVSKDGKTIRALKVLKTDWTPIRSSRHGTSKIPSRQWQIPKEFQEWAKRQEADIQDFLCANFVEAIVMAEGGRQAMTRIAVTKHRMTAVFTVNIRRTAYFFQDRDIQVTQAGTRKPVFHLVRPHVRKDGTAVKMHFRGVRDFTWAGYGVHISIPGFDHIDIADFELGGIDLDRLTPEQRKGMITQAETGKELVNAMRRGWRQ